MPNTRDISPTHTSDTDNDFSGVHCAGEAWRKVWSRPTHGYFGPTHEIEVEEMFLASGERVRWKVVVYLVLRKRSVAKCGRKGGGTSVYLEVCIGYADLICVNVDVGDLGRVHAETLSLTGNV